MRAYHLENLSHDPVHGYIAFSSDAEATEGETVERQVIDHPWVQRLRQIHQLQTAWWVFPTAEHTRFQHVLGVMHLASRAAEELYPSLVEADPSTPSRPYVESLLRMAGLLHDVGHGPFGHFFDEHYLQAFGLTHETLGTEIIVHELGELLRGLRQNPNGRFQPDERLDPEHVAWLITRPSGSSTAEDKPTWLQFLRALLSGIYTIDNLDFVLRDAYMSGFSPRSFDLERLLHYSFFSERGLTIHDRGVDALVRFLGAKADLFRSVYFHRTVRAMDIELAELFAHSRERLFPGNPRDRLDDYLHFTEWSLLVDVRRWARSSDAGTRELGERWQRLLAREIPWKMVCQRNLVFSETDQEQASIFSDSAFVARKLRDHLPPEVKDADFRVDVARHIHRPHTRGHASGQNFLYDSAAREVKPLNAYHLYKRLPVSHRICRIYARTHEHAQPLAAALDNLIGGTGGDDLTNM